MLKSSITTTKKKQTFRDNTTIGKKTKKQKTKNKQKNKNFLLLYTKSNLNF